MNNEELQKNIQVMEAELAKMKVQLKEAEELKPKDWEDEECFQLDDYGFVVYSTNTSGMELFQFKEKPAAEKFARKLKIMSVINNLKASLGDEHEFTEGEENWYLVYDDDAECWGMGSNKSYDSGGILFSAHNPKLIDCMNKNFPEGWE